MAGDHHFLGFFSVEHGGHVRRVMLLESMTSIELALKVNDVIGAIFFCDSTPGCRTPSR
jgi:hypothetical protein